MSRKSVIDSYQLVDGQSLGASFQTAPITVKTIDNVGVNIEAAGVTKNSGTFGIQHRIYKDANHYSAWATLSLSPAPTLADADDVSFINLNQLPPGQIRVTFTAADFEVQTLTFPAKAASTGGDYVVITDGSGLEWAVALNKSGADAEPTGAAWAAIPAGRQVNCDISGGTTAASVAALVETALDGLTGLTAAMTTDDSAADGTMLITMLAAGQAANPAPHNANDSGVGSITGVETSGPDGTCDIWVSGCAVGG